MSQAGNFREQVTFYFPAVSVSDGAGGFRTAGTESSITRWAQVVTLQGKEDLINGKIVYRQPYKVTVRYDENLTNTARLVWKNKKLSITSIVADEHQTEIYLTCLDNR